MPVERSVEILKDAVARHDGGAFVTSSFQTQSLPMLHLVSLHTPEAPVVFLDTGHHFPETLEYRDQLRELLQIDVLQVGPRHGAMAEANAAREGGDTDRCCQLLKVESMDWFTQIPARTCWISGVRRDQTRARSGLAVIEETEGGVERVHPLIDWTADDVELYILKHDLPRHPLWHQGFESIGCAPCTVRGAGRSGRWSGSSKEGCGIHHLLNREPCPEDG